MHVLEGHPASVQRLACFRGSDSGATSSALLLSSPRLSHTTSISSIMHIQGLSCKTRKELLNCPASCEHLVSSDIARAGAHGFLIA